MKSQTGITLVAAAALALFANTIPSSASTFTILKTFGHAQGLTERPNGMLLPGPGGLGVPDIVGVTRFGKKGRGSVYRWTAPDTYEVVHSFKGDIGNDGEQPYGALISDSAGNLYGTTWTGGLNGSDSGTVYRISATGKESVLYAFGGDADGACPVAGLVMDGAGNLYGTTGGATYCGGSAGGTAFQLVPPKRGKGLWTQNVLHVFPVCGSSCSDGDGPAARLVFDGSGNLYGTTTGGGSHGNGTVFELSPGTGSGCMNGWCETVLHSFHNLDGEGFAPGGLTFDAGGLLYGTAAFGGGHDEGTVFRMTPDGGAWHFDVLYDFCGVVTGGHCLDGDNPQLPSGLQIDEQNGLYGTTAYGGEGTNGSGTVFVLTSGTGQFCGDHGWCVTILHSFLGGKHDGSEPHDGLIRDPASGALFGTTHFGGGSPSGNGTVWELSP